LPLSLTEADPAAVATLAAAGITTFGQACALPRAALARRVGEDFVVLLDRVRGLIPDPRPPFVPPPRYAGKLDLPAPVANAEALAFAVNRLVLELAGWLAGRGLGVTEMSLALAHERYVGVKTGVPTTTARFALAAPAREPAHLVAVLRERLARVALPAPVETITLTSEATAPLASRNLGLLPGDDAAATVPLLDRLRARLGEGAVMLVAPHAEHRPERAWDESRARLDFSENSPQRNSRAKKVESYPAFCAPRPVWLLAEPEPLGHRLEAQPWVLRDGPERIESGWWDGRDVRRDYFVAENPRGEIVWIYRDHRYGIDDGEWFLHGVFA
jgi:protein ImuB